MKLRSRVAGMRIAGVTTEDAVKRRQAIERAHREHGDAAAWASSGQSNATLTAARKRNSVEIRQSCRGLWNTQVASHPVQVSKQVVTGEHHSRDCMERKPSIEFAPLGDKVLASQISTDPTHRMHRRYNFGMWLGNSNNSAKCFGGAAESVCVCVCVQSSRKQKTEPQIRWDEQTISSAIGAL